MREQPVWPLHTACICFRTWRIHRHSSAHNKWRWQPVFLWRVDAAGAPGLPLSTAITGCHHYSCCCCFCCSFSLEFDFAAASCTDVLHLLPPPLLLTCPACYFFFFLFCQTHAYNAPQNAFTGDPHQCNESPKDTAKLIELPFGKLVQFGKQVDFTYVSTMTTS